MESIADNNYDGPIMDTTVNRLGYRVHRLADDLPTPSRERHSVTIRRDSMVEALFGAGPASTPRKSNYKQS